MGLFYPDVRGAVATNNFERLAKKFVRVNYRICNCTDSYTPFHRLPTQIIVSFLFAYILDANQQRLCTLNKAHCSEIFVKFIDPFILGKGVYVIGLTS